MRKTVIVILFLAAAIAGCQQKEEPQHQFPTGPVQTGPIQMQDEVKLLQDAVKEDPQNVNAWIKLGNSMMDTSRFSEAIEAYKKALEIDPKNVDVRVDMGTCYRGIKRPDLALKEYRKALEINPKHLNAHKNLGVVLAYDLNDKSQAIKEFNKYIELAPNAPDVTQVKQAILELKAEK